MARFTGEAVTTNTYIMDIELILLIELIKLRLCRFGVQYV